ncbi:MAG: hypothetical protein F4W90_06665 [Gammaproteobacteria bacterium]|nr:hypothetical protein [Gammaproteobacteria bacterium]
MNQLDLSPKEQQDLYRDGFVVLRGVVPNKDIQRAKGVIEAGMNMTEHRLLPPAELATHPDVIGTFKQSKLATILKNAMGPYPEVVSCQIAVTPGHNKLFGKPTPHVDGSWSGLLPTNGDEIEPVRGRPRDPVPYFGENDDKRGRNDGMLWQDPDRRISLGSYTALVGVALNDQRRPGNGQFAVLKGTHELVEAAFQMQRDTGSVIGPEGTGWPRIRVDPETGKPQLNGLPATVREVLPQLAADAPTLDGWPWPELTPVCLDAGDAVIALHACPHTATPNLGPNPRMNLYFRIRRLRPENPLEGLRKIGHGVSDHPDRGYYGQFLDFPESYDPWQTSIDKLCDHWSEWEFTKEKASPEVPGETA